MARSSSPTASHQGVNANGTAVVSGPTRHARRERSSLRGVDLSEQGEINDFILIHWPTARVNEHLRPELFPGKRYRINSEGLIEKPDNNRASWFRCLLYAFTSITGLHQAFERIRNCVDTAGAAAYVVCGDLAPGANPKSATRIKASTPRGKTEAARPRGLVDSNRCWLVLDLDKISNASGIDPREGAAACVRGIEYLRQFLPQAFRVASCSWQFSGSTCLAGADDRPLAVGTPPPVLSAHLRFLLDGALDERGRRALLMSLSAYVRSSLDAAQLTCKSTNPVDPAVATYNQPIFICTQFENGLQDPLPTRSGLFRTEYDWVALADLEAQLAASQDLIQNKGRIGVGATSRKSAKAGRQSKASATSLPSAGSPPVPAFAKDVGELPSVTHVRLLQRPRSADKKAVVLHKSRLGKLSDIVTLTDDRRCRDAAWADGLPVGHRRRVMMIVAGLLSHLVPPDELRHAIETYALRLTTREWYEGEWLARNQDNSIWKKAQLAAAADSSGGDGSMFREDPWLERIMQLMSPTREEMVRLKLRALRTDAARKEIARRAAGTPTRAEWRAQRRATSEANQRPWEIQGISESTYRRRKRSAESASLARATNLESATLSSARLVDICDFLRLAYRQDDLRAARHLAKGPLAGLGIAGISFDRRFISEHLYELGHRWKNRHISEIGGKLSLIASAVRAGETTRRILEYILGDKGFGLLAWAHAQGETRGGYTVKSLLDLADMLPLPDEFLEAYETGRIVPSATAPRNDGASAVITINQGGPAQSVIVAGPPGYPGPEVAGCSRATWFRRKAKEGAAAVGKPDVSTPDGAGGESDGDDDDVPF